MGNRAANLAQHLDWPVLAKGPTLVTKMEFVLPVQEFPIQMVARSIMVIVLAILAILSVQSILTPAFAVSKLVVILMEPAGTVQLSLHLGLSL
jgi:hypothetical protein